MKWVWGGMQASYLLTQAPRLLTGSKQMVNMNETRSEGSPKLKATTSCLLCSICPVSAIARPVALIGSWLSSYDLRHRPYHTCCEESFFHIPQAAAS